MPARAARERIQPEVAAAISADDLRDGEETSGFQAKAELACHLAPGSSATLPLRVDNAEYDGEHDGGQGYLEENIRSRRHSQLQDDLAERLAALHPLLSRAGLLERVDRVDRRLQFPLKDQRHDRGELL